MNIIFRDRNPRVVAAIQDAFCNVPELHAECCDIFAGNIKADAIVSPANCIGRMDGGIDAVYLLRFGQELQHRVYSAIPYARLAIGKAAAVSTGDNKIPLLIVAPTMDWPPGDVSDTDNAYHAFHAALGVAKDHSVEMLLITGFGTLTGRIPAKEAAYQMWLAWCHAIEGEPHG